MELPRPAVCPDGLATDGGPTPASPRSPLHPFNELPPVPSLPASGSGSASPPVGEPLCPPAPSGPTPCADLWQEGAVATPPLRVYSRRRRRRCRARSPASPAAVDPSLSPGAGSQLQRLDMVRKPVDTLLPQPVIQKRRKKAPQPGALPRRSRRVAGAAPAL